MAKKEVKAHLHQILKPSWIPYKKRKQVQNCKIMKSIIKELLFDKELVENLKKVKTSKNILYQQLISGRITLQEYLAAQAGNTSN